MTPQEIKISVDTDDDNNDEPKKLSIWQKLKQLSAFITAIGALVTALIGGYIMMIDNNKQDKVSESAYTVVVERMNELVTTIAVLENEIKHINEDIHEMKASMKQIHKRHPAIAKEKPTTDREPILPEPSADIIENVTEDEKKPTSIILKGPAKLPDYRNVQKMVEEKGDVIKYND